MKGIDVPVFPGLFRSTALVAFIVFPPSIYTDYQDGLDAYSQGNYEGAMTEWLAVTESPASTVNPLVFAESHYAIAKLYWLGQGVRQDMSEARIWLLKAADLGHAGAMAKLGFLYTDGNAVPQDFNEAFDWYQKAAKLGDVDGLYNLGIFYLNGWGTPQDTTMAKQYLAAASAQGDAAAEEAFQRLMSAEAAQYQVSLVEETVPEDEGPEPEVEIEIFAEPWIMAQPPDDYTIQVIALSSSEKIRELLEGFESLAPFAIYTVQQNTRPLHVLVQGSYSDVEAARATRERFPPEIQDIENLWIRRFGMVQDLIEKERDVATP